MLIKDLLSHLVIPQDGCGLLKTTLLFPEDRDTASYLEEGVDVVLVTDDLLGLYKVCNIAFIVKTTSIKSSASH